MFKIAKSKLPELLKAIAAQQELFLPVNNNGQVNFAAWFEGCNADIETLKTVKSPKDMFFPQSETLYTVKKEQHKLSVEPQALADQMIKCAAYSIDAAVRELHFWGEKIPVYLSGSILQVLNT